MKKIGSHVDELKKSLDFCNKEEIPFCIILGTDERARVIANETLKKVQSAVGLLKF